MWGRTARETFRLFPERFRKTKVFVTVPTLWARTVTSISKKLQKCYKNLKKNM